MNQVKENGAKEQAVRFLVGNKSDLAEKRKVAEDKGSKFATANKMKFFETSAKAGTNIVDLFDMAAQCSVNMYVFQILSLTPRQI